MGICEYHVAEQWSCNVPFSAPVAGNIDHTGAGEVNRLPHVARRTFTIGGANNWKQVGLRVLSTTGRKPDCAPLQIWSTTKVGPPRNKNGNLIESNPKNTAWPGEFLRKTEARDLQGRKPRQDPEDGILSFTVCVFFQSGRGASRSGPKATEGDIFSQGRAQGRADEGCPPPVRPEMLGLARALEIVAGHLRVCWGRFLGHVRVRTAGTWLGELILKWLNEGAFSTDAAGASDAVRLLRVLDTHVRCPVCLPPLQEGFFAESGMRGADAAAAIMFAARRLYRIIARSVLLEWGGCVPLSPRTKEEAEKRVFEGCKREEAWVIRWLGDLGSEACDVFN